MRALLISVLVLTSSAALARPPPGSDGHYSAWYRSLTIPGTSLSCCSKADCRPVGFRTRNGHYEAFIDRTQFTDGPDEWVRVPELENNPRQAEPDRQRAGVLDALGQRALLRAAVDDLKAGQSVRRRRRRRPSGCPPRLPAG